MECRRLWQQVTAVSGGRNGMGGHMVTPEPTVEDLVEAVRKLPPDNSAVPAVAQGWATLSDFSFTSQNVAPCDT